MIKIKEHVTHSYSKYIEFRMILNNRFPFYFLEFSVTCKSNHQINNWLLIRYTSVIIHTNGYQQFLILLIIGFTRLTL